MSRRAPWFVASLMVAVIVGPGLAWAVPPALTLDRTSGPPTTSVLVTGVGFQPEEVVAFAFGTKGRGTAVADVAGSVSKRTTVPRSATEGDHEITATGETSLLEASATFTVVFPSITLDRAEGPPMVEVSVAGASFVSLESVKVAFDGDVVDKVPTDATGAFSTALGVPRTATAGSHLITATGQTSGLEAIASFDVRIDAWPAYGFNAAHAGLNPREDVLDASNVGDLASAWTTTLEAGGGLAEGFSSPAIVKSVVYLGAENGRVFALDAWTGRVRWSVGSGVHRWSSPTVAKGTLYIGGGSLSALRASTGDVRWRVKTADETYSPTVSRGMVYAATKNGTLYAVAASDGTVAWTRELGDTEAPGIGAAPSVAGGIVYAPSASGDLYALDAETGDTVWSTFIEADLGVAPAIVDGVAFVPSGEHLTALDASTGSILWSTPVPGGLSSPAVDGGVVFVGGDDALYAVDAATGAPVWTAPLGYSAESSPAVANGVVYGIGTAGGPTASLYAVDEITGETLWSADVGAESRPDPRVVNGMVYSGSEDGRVYAFALT